MSMAVSSFNFIFLNTYGADDNVVFIEQLCKKNDILFLCETWLKEEQKYILSYISTDHRVFFKSDMVISPRFGRPYGGRCWFVRNSIEVISCDFINESISILKFKKNNKLFCVIGVYLPYDDNKQGSFSEYSSLLCYIRELVRDTISEGFSVFIGGDFNADVKRGNRFDVLLQNYINENNYRLVDHEFSSSHDFTYFKGLYKAFIDHCIVPRQNDMLSIQCEVLYSDINTSDHNALSIKGTFLGNQMYSVHENTQSNTVFTIPPDFKNEKIKDYYKELVDFNLTNFPDRIMIENESNRQLVVNTMYEQLTEGIKDAYSQLSKTVNKCQKNTKVSWFTDELREIKGKIMEFRGYVSNNPTEEAISDLKYWKTKFRRIQRRNTRMLEKQNYKDIEKLSKEGNKDRFWRKIRQARDTSGKDDVKASLDSVKDHFAKVFEAPFKASPEMTRKAETSCKELDDFTDFHGVELNPVWLQYALKDTRMSHVSGYDGLSSHMLLNCLTSKVKDCLFLFFEYILKHGVIPSDFNVSLIRPIIKDHKKSSEDVGNLRPISISNTLSQIFERILLNKMPELHRTHRNQFGFKRSTSTIHALFSVKETIIKYVEGGSPCHVVSLDAEKAFDKVWRAGLFHKMKEKKVDLDTLKILKKYYDTSQGMIRLNGVISSRFDIKCGVKQGGILSPYLFNFFINDLIEECIEKNIGAKFEQLNLSIIVYCDDILLISPIEKHLQILINICGEYGYSWGIKFNPDKSSFISFGNQIYNDTKFYINNNELKSTDCLKYLGITFNKKLDMNDFAIEKFKTVTKSFFSLNSFGLKPGGLNPFLQAYLYKTFCLSKFLYGLEIMTLNMGILDKLDLTQNAIVRYIAGLYRTSHISPVLRTLKLFNIRELYLFFKLTFIKNMKKSFICLYIFNYLNNNRNNYKERTLSFVRDLKTLSKTLRLDTDFIVEKVISVIMNFKKEAREFDEEDITLLLVRDCLHNYESYPFQQILNRTLHY